MQLPAATKTFVAIILLTILNYAQGEPMVSVFSPPYGPLLGGTEVEINITNAQGYNATSIQLANVNAQITNSSLINNTLKITCMSGESSSPIDEKVTVTLLHQNGRLVIRSDNLYSYKPNPKLDKLENNAVVKGGGIRLWVTGMNLLSVMSPTMTIRTIFEGMPLKFEVSCVPYNNTKMFCISPRIKLITTKTSTTASTKVTTPPTKPSTTTTTTTTTTLAPSTILPTQAATRITTDPTKQSTFTSTIQYTSSQTTPLTPQAQTTTPIILGRRQRRQAEDKPEFFADFQLDAVPYSNFSRILVYEDPVFHTFEEKDQTRNFFPLEEIEIIIKGERLSLALQPDDIKVYIGKEDCAVTSLSVNQLKCAPPTDQPDLPVDQTKHRVSVKAGESLDYFIGYLRYGKLDRIDSKILMLILIGVGVFIFLVFVFGIGCYVTRRRKKMRSRHSTAGSNNSTGQTYLTDNYGSDTDSQGLPFTGTMFNTDPLDILPPDLRHKVINCRLDSNRLHVGQCIGTGSYGRVFRGTLLGLEDEDSFVVAVKTLKKVSVYYEREMTDFLHEALIMKDLRHPNIIHLHGVVIFNYAPFVAFEFMDLGDLRTYIKREKNIPLKKLLTFALQIAHALTYLSSQNFVHMDVAARNCLINTKMKVKLGDFGLSRDLHGLDYYKLTDRAKPMPVKWMALESLQWGRFTSHSDVWSFGILLWELLTRGQRPYETVDNMDIKAHIASGHRLPKPSLGENNVYNIMTLTWREDPSSRPTFEELVIKLQEAIDRIPS